MTTINDKKASPTVTKSVAEIYMLRNLPGGFWADISLHCGEKSGRIQVASDYGDWQHYWSACGESFKKFLQSLDRGYLAGKFRTDSWFDAEATIKGFQADLIRARKEGVLDKETAKEMREEIGKLLKESHRREDFNRTLERCPSLLKYYEWMPDLRTSIDPYFARFWSECWPVFLAELKKEEA